MRYRLAHRALFQNFLVALMWPFFAAVVHVRNFPRHRLLSGFVLFCGFAGLVFVPSAGSDAHTYMLRFEALRAGGTSLSGEPVPMALMAVVAWLDLDVRWYFALVGLLYGLVVATVARLLFRDVPRDVVLSLAAVVFLAAFFLNHPVFSAINARYYLGVWVLILATMLTLHGRWKHALAVAGFGVMIHFGHIVFAVALFLVVLSRRLGPWQIFFAYLVLGIAFVLPPWVFVTIGDYAAQVLGHGALSEKLETHVGYAERLAEFGFLSEREEYPWFLLWFSTPIFWSLLITGHLLFWQMRQERKDPLYQLWVLIIIMWALQFAMSGYAGGEGRMQRNTTALLLLWHARLFLVREQGAKLILLINAFPFLFYFVVAYRRWFEQASLGSFLPAPLGVWPDIWPTVMRFFGFD